MNPRIEGLKQRVRAGEHKRWRQTTPISILPECEAEGLSWPRRMARLTRRQCEAEQVVIEANERIVFTRTLPAAIPPVYSEQDWESLAAGRTLRGRGPVSNVCADWELALSQGLAGRRAAALAARKALWEASQADPEAVEFLDGAVETIDAVLGLARRYAQAAQRLGRKDLVEVLEGVPAGRPRSFHAALQSLRFMQAVVWFSGHYHVGLGRFDQYMWPYLQADLRSGRLDRAGAEELLAEFFIDLNKDSDLYPGMQQGDNGQTLTVGGVDRDGKDAENELTSMVLRVSRDLAMIDPKINLRLSPRTRLDLLCLAAELTREGLGFPQYSNDDVVIPGLVAHGYRLEDARDYTVAACWEFIIPGQGMDLVNIGALSFPAAADQGIRTGLAAGEGFAGILQRVKTDIQGQVDCLAAAYEAVLLPPAPYYSVLMTGCLESGRDLTRGARYNNFGIHGAGVANAAGALAAVRQFIFEEGSLDPTELVAALDADFEGYADLLAKLKNEGPKVGNHDDRADSLMTWLFDAFADACEGYGCTSRGGILRPGSGSAMYYLWLVQGHADMREPVVGATAEGRQKGQPLGANLAPEQGVRIRGPISELQSFAKIDYRRICNGGPITMELSDTVFRDAEALRKVALLVRTFAQLGCQQLQLNSLDLETLLDAKTHPERHPNLIVRVWGWSGYFCELSPEYQDHIIARQRLSYFTG
jgi:formate C-acetyltransferase